MNDEGRPRMNLLIGHAAVSSSEHRHNSARSSGETELGAATNEIHHPRPCNVRICFVLRRQVAGGAYARSTLASTTSFPA